MIADKISRFFQQNCSFLFGLVQVKDIPTDIARVAFWGRSNVGKSSLINSLLFRKYLVRSSNKPGRTREINFFSLLDIFYFVDLPGYGYASMNKTQKNKLDKLSMDYLISDLSLKRVFLLIDSRVSFKAIDFEAMNILNHTELSYQIIFTKADKVKKADITFLQEQFDKMSTDNPACFPSCLFVSTKNKDGLDDLRTIIYELST